MKPLPGTPGTLASRSIPRVATTTERAPCFRAPVQCLSSASLQTRPHERRSGLGSSLMRSMEYSNLASPRPASTRLSRFLRNGVSRSSPLLEILLCLCRMRACLKALESTTWSCRCSAGTPAPPAHGHLAACGNRNGPFGPSMFTHSPAQSRRATRFSAATSTASRVAAISARSACNFASALLRHASWRTPVSAPHFCFSISARPFASALATS